MSTAALYSKFDLLPEHLKQQVLDYVDFLLSREGNQKTTKQLIHSNLPVNLILDKDRQANHASPAVPKRLKAGFLKDSFVMAADFDDPLEDFKEYME
jgi:Protein of unknown function (DUF2281)